MVVYEIQNSGQDPTVEGKIGVIREKLDCGEDGKSKILVRNLLGLLLPLGIGVASLLYLPDLLSTSLSLPLAFVILVRPVTYKKPEPQRAPVRFTTWSLF